MTLYSDPTDPELLGQPFDGEGLPIGRTVWIEKGVLKNLSYTRFWAQKQGKQPTGWWRARRRPRADWRHEEHRGADRRLRARHLVTHFFYIRSLDPRTVLQTGLTRDGTFLIENGKITRAEELPLEREPAADAEPARGHRPAGADGGRTDDAGAPRARLQLRVAVGRRMGPQLSSCFGVLSPWLSARSRWLVAWTTKDPSRLKDPKA